MSGASLLGVGAALLAGLGGAARAAALVPRARAESLRLAEPLLLRAPAALSESALLAAPTGQALLDGAPVGPSRPALPLAPRPDSRLLPRWDVATLDRLFDGSGAKGAAGPAPPLPAEAKPLTSAPKAVKEGAGWWTPLIGFVPGGVVIGVQIGRADAPYLPPGAMPSREERIGALKAREERIATPPWTALAVAASTAIALRVAKAYGWIETPEKNLLLDTALDFGVAYGLGAGLSPGEVHRDIGLGFLNGLAFAGARAVIGWLRGEPAKDPRYDILAFELVYAVQGRLPWRGNPLPTDGLDTGGAVANAFTDTAVHAGWTGLAGGLGNMAREARAGEPAFPAFLRGAAAGAAFGGATRASFNLIFGPRVRVGEGFWSDSTAAAEANAGVRLSLPRESVDLRVGGLQSFWRGSYNAGTWPDFLDFRDRPELTTGILAHERFHFEYQLLGRGILNFYVPYLAGGFAGDEPLAYAVEGD